MFMPVNIGSMHRLTQYSSNIQSRLFLKNQQQPALCVVYLTKRLQELSRAEYTCYCAKWTSDIPVQRIRIHPIAPKQSL